jgi:hypothetical protein
MPDPERIELHLVRPDEVWRSIHSLDLPLRAPTP